MKRHSNSSSSLSVASDPPLPVLTAVDPLPEAPPTQPPPDRQIKLALDVHAGDLMVVRRVDGAKPQPHRKCPRTTFFAGSLNRNLKLKKFSAAPRRARLGIGFTVS